MKVRIMAGSGFGRFELRQVLGRVLLELRLALVAAEFDLLSLVNNHHGFAHAAELLAGDDADIERVWLGSDRRGRWRRRWCRGGFLLLVAGAEEEGEGAENEEWFHGD